MPIPDLWNMLGFSNNAVIFMEEFGGVSNIVLSGNPTFTVNDFSSIFPVFSINKNEAIVPETIPLEYFNLVLAMANASIKYDRYKTSWKYFMCLYIAHFLTLFLQTQLGDSNSQKALQGAMPTGFKSSKSVDGLSVSYDLMGIQDDLSGYGTWKLTTYGQQLATMTKIYGHAGMWVNG